MPRRLLTPSSKPDEDLAVSAPEADAYELQSSGVIEMLEKLLDKFRNHFGKKGRDELSSGV